MSINQHPRLQVIIGATRETRAADRVSPWVIERARQHGAFEVEVLDLRDWPLPMFAENIKTIGDISAPTYSAPIVREWNKKVGEANAFLFVTPEYNHSIPGVLKNAIDSVFLSFAFRHKPAGFVGYSVGIAGGARAVEHFSSIAFELEMIALRNSVLIPRVDSAFDPDGRVLDPATEAAIKITMDDLAWWTPILTDARKTQLAPGNFRLRAALSARAQASR
jgi:NAD(P)H-dependent FMN reductase